MSEAKVALGKRLFFEPQLSVNGRYSCASCHDPARSFSDGRTLAVGTTGDTLPHNAMALINVAYNVSFGWTDPRGRSLEAQMLKPLLARHPVELGLAGREASVCAALAADPQYRSAFAAAFPQGAAPRQDAAGAVTFDHIVKAIAAFERTLISGRSPFDRYVFSGEHGALSAEAKRVPTLRNIALTAPYMHDGRFATLAQVLEHYSELGRRAQAPEGGHQDRRLPQRPLSARERAELSAFLESLTDESFARRYAPDAGASQVAGK